MLLYHIFTLRTKSPGEPGQESCLHHELMMSRSLSLHDCLDHLRSFTTSPRNVCFSFSRELKVGHHEVGGKRYKETSFSLIRSFHSLRALKKIDQTTVLLNVPTVVKPIILLLFFVCLLLARNISSIYHVQGSIMHNFEKITFLSLYFLIFEIRVIEPLMHRLLFY